MENEMTCGGRKPIPGDIPEPHRPLFEAIDREVTWLHAVWIIYRQLYGRDEATVNLLNKVAPAFFRVVQDAILDDVLLSITRISDPPVSGAGRQANLVLERLRPLAKESGEPLLVSELDEALSKLKDACEVLRKHRHKRIAHLDMDVAMEMMTLPGYSRQTIEDALDAVRRVMNSMNHFYRHGPTVYEATSTLGDGDSLLAIIRDGLRLRKMRRIAHRATERELREQLNDRGPVDDNY
jgi:hypothetical protein